MEKELDREFIIEMLYIDYMSTYGSRSYLASSHYYIDLIDKGLKHHLKALYIYDENDLDDWFIYIGENEGSEALRRYEQDGSIVKTIKSGEPQL